MIMKSRCLNHYRGYSKSFLELNSKRLYKSSGKEKESRCPVFTSSTKLEIWHFHVVIRAAIAEKFTLHVHVHVQSCCFANTNQFPICRPRYRRRCRCLSSLLPGLRAPSTGLDGGLMGTKYPGLCKAWMHNARD